MIELELGMTRRLMKIVPEMAGPIVVVVVVVIIVIVTVTVFGTRLGWA